MYAVDSPPTMCLLPPMFEVTDCYATITFQPYTLEDKKRKKSKNDAKMLGALLVGVNRAFPFARGTRAFLLLLIK